MSSNFIKYRPHSPLDVKKGYSQQGFTLVELIVTIAIMAILASIAVPSMLENMAKQDIKDTTSILLSALKDAKSESIILDDDITLTYASTNNTLKVTRGNGEELGTKNLGTNNTVTLSNDDKTQKIKFGRDKTASKSTIKICNKKGTIKGGTEIKVSPTAVISVKGVACS